MTAGDSKNPYSGNRWIPAAAVATAAVLACVGAVWGYHVGQTGAVGVALPETSDPTVLTACANLVKALPSELEGKHRRGAVGTADHVRQRAAVWGSPTTVLRCGVAEPAAIVVGGPDYTPLSNQYASMGDDTSQVNWLIEDNGTDSVTYTTTDRAVYVEVTVPYDGAAQKQDASNALVDLAPLIVKTVPTKAGQFVSDQIQ
ncbi:DUF3515 domain-containing protein [Catenulispora sp. EB89]|uniref:DUF3515 domain-containing protein n=1 Tax=Catenulispora sp. EB89 TaxID=3156257 RepID=UPI00351293D8